VHSAGPHQHTPCFTPAGPQIFQCHYLRYLYALFEDEEPPKYILDAGANAGFSTLLFKLLWPDATVVSLEPDPSNFDMLKRNTAG
jgi:predicted O-methyltransferase YrrM